MSDCLSVQNSSSFNPENPSSEELDMAVKAVRLAGTRRERLAVRRRAAASADPGRGTDRASAERVDQQIARVDRDGSDGAAGARWLRAEHGRVDAHRRRVYEAAGEHGRAAEMHIKARQVRRRAINREPPATPRPARDARDRRCARSAGPRTRSSPQRAQRGGVTQVRGPRARGGAVRSRPRRSSSARYSRAAPRAPTRASRTCSSSSAGRPRCAPRASRSARGTCSGRRSTA